MDLSTARKPDAAAGKPAGSIIDLLERDPGRFEPVTALRIAEAAAEGDLDIAAHTGVSPAPLAVSALKAKGGRLSIRSALAALTGPLGSMPSTYNEQILREERNRSRALASFFDLFSARMTELFADACEKYRIARRLRWSGDRRANAFVVSLLALAGFGTKRLVERSGVDQDIILRFSGFFASRNRNTTSMRAMLEEFTGLPVDVELFHGRWLTIPQADRSRIGDPQGVQLGVNATAGAAFRDFNGSFRIVVGPLDYPDYLSLSPGGQNIRDIFALTRLYVGPALDFDVQVVLRKEAIPLCRLGQTEGEPPRLGWNSWARIAPAAKDSGDAIIAEHLLPDMEEGVHAA
jgi:type VI secretion system protein ImpH